MKRKINKRSMALLVSLAVVLTAAVGVTLAYIIARTQEIQNIFDPAHVKCAVVENGLETEHYEDTVTASEKKNVQIKNTGDTTAYIRVAIVVTWKNEAGHVWAKQPVVCSCGGEHKAEVTSCECFIDWSFDDSGNPTWFKGDDGYYYFKESVSANELTDILIKEAKQLKASPEAGYYLSIEIVASAIQANPASVVESQWGVEVADDGTISE